LITPSVYGGQGGDLGSIKPGDLWSHHHAGPEPARASKNFQTPPVYGGQGGDLGSIKPGDLWSHHHAGPEPARASKNFQTPPVYGGQGGDLGSIKPGDLRSHHLAGLERAKPPVREASCLHSVLKGKEGTSENGGVFDNSPRLRGARGGSWFDQTWRPADVSPHWFGACEASCSRSILSASCPERKGMDQRERTDNDQIRSPHLK
jgi:hypothetical protein